MDNSTIYDHLKEIFISAVKRVDPYQMIINHVHRHGDTLKINFETNTFSLDLDNFHNIYVIGAGKATAKMAKAIAEILKNRINRGIIAVKYGHSEPEPVQRIRVIEAGHPVPDENSMRSALEIEKISKLTDEKTLVINLISGGGSALLASPIMWSSESKIISLTLDDMQKTTQILLSCGAPIEEINCIRKHISNIKGGKLARMMYPATLLNFILSDVVGDRLDTIASGLTTFDETTYDDALKIIEKYGIGKDIPEKVRFILEAGKEGLIQETPKKNANLFSKVYNVLIGTNHTALLAAKKAARERGYDTAVLSSQITGEAMEAAKFYFGIAMDIKKHDLLLEKPACVIGGGETTVTIKGSGKGGRNQELALSFLSEMKKEKKQTDGICFLAASTDGNDGPTDAAGAFASQEILEKSEEMSLSIQYFLENNDSYSFFDWIGYLFKTGPTNTNVCDIQIAIVK